MLSIDGLHTGGNTMLALLPNRKILELLLQGCGAAEIAAQLGVEENEVHERVARLLREIASRRRPIG